MSDAEQGDKRDVTRAVGDKGQTTMDESTSDTLYVQWLGRMARVLGFLSGGRRIENIAVYKSKFVKERMKR